MADYHDQILCCLWSAEKLKIWRRSVWEDVKKKPMVMYTILGVHTIITGQKSSILSKQKVTHQKFEHVSFVWQIIYGTFFNLWFKKDEDASE